MKTAGVIFDFYDDPKGEVLKSVFPTADELPGSIKVAHILSPEERDVLRDEAFALVAVNDGKLLRKFACVDKGNTILSAIYFDKVAHLLPENVREAVDGRIKEAIFSFNLAEKTAAPTPGRKRDPMKQPLVSDDADWAQRTNLLSVRGGSDNSKVTDAASITKTAESDKEAMFGPAPGGALRPSFYTGARSATKAGKKLTGDALKKATESAEKDFFKRGPKAVEGVKSKAAGVFDLSNHHPVEVDEKLVTKTAMVGRYPLDSYSDVQQAVAYYDTNWTEMDPSDRREFCTKTAARANEIGVKLAESMIRYASTTYADDVEAHLASRRLHADGEFHELYDALQEKRAEIEPEEFAELLHEVDKIAGVHWLYGGEVCDQFLSTFGGLGQVKVASYKVAGKEIDDTHLHELAARDGLKGVFDFSDDFNKDPVTIFASLPDDAKSIIATLALE